MDNQVPEVVKTMRVNQLLALSEQLSKRYASTQEGKILQVIIEEAAPDKEGWLTGHAGNYIKVEFEGSRDLIGKMVSVKINKAGYPVCEGVITEWT